MESSPPPSLESIDHQLWPTTLSSPVVTYLEMAIVPCGDETGEYYIIVSGLPWSATWQKLKDFVRYPKTGGCINVEHVYIYPSTTDGWVKVRGKEDFERAYGETADTNCEQTSLILNCLVEWSRI